MRRWTRKAIAWTTGGIIALLVGLWRVDYEMVAFGMLLALMLLVAYVRRTPRVVARRRPSRLQVLEEDTYGMAYDVGAEGGWADSVELHDSVPGYMRLAEGTNHMVLPLYAGELRRPGYALHCPLRGSYRLGPTELRVSDALGFFDSESQLADVHEVDVVPLYVELRSMEMGSRALRYNMGPVTVNEMGRSTDFYSIREYIKGDPYKKINWKASARHQSLMINEDEKETLSDCAIIVDSRALSSTGAPLINFHETSLRATLGLARTLVAEKNRVMVVTYNDAVNIVPPGLGRSHNRVVQAMLVETVASGALTFDWAAGYTRPFLKPRSEVVVFSPLVSDMTFYPTVLGLIRSGHRVVVVTTALEEYEEHASGAAGPRALLMGLQRTTNIAELEAAGVPVIEVEPEEPQLSVMVRVSAALGGERLDVTALEGEAAEELPEFEEAPTVGRARAMSVELQEEVLGFRLTQPRLVALQVMALVSLMAACLISWRVNEEAWLNLNTIGWGTLIDHRTYSILTLTGLLLGWALAMLLGFVEHNRRRNPGSYVPQLAYLLVALIIIWHVSSVLYGLGIGGGPRPLVWDLALLPPLLGSLAVFRRAFGATVIAMAILMAVGLVYANSMDEAWRAIVMAVLAMLTLELSWGVERFNGIHALLGRTTPSRRWLRMYNASVDRYLMVLAIHLGAAAVAVTIMTFLPGWYVADTPRGIPSPLDAETAIAPVYLLFWLVVVALVGRWAVINLMGSRTGQRVIGYFRPRLVLPWYPRRTAAAIGGSTGQAIRGDGTSWEEETPPPEVPVPRA